MAKYKILQAFKLEGVWYKQGAIVEFEKEKIKEPISLGLVAAIREEPEIETATKKTGAENAMLNTGGGAGDKSGGKGGGGK